MHNASVMRRRPAGLQGHEDLVGRLGEADAPAPGQGVVGRDDQAQLLFVEAAGDQVGGVGDRRGEAQVQLPRAQPLQHGLAVVLHEAEADPGVVGAEGVQQAGDGLGAHGVQEAEGDLAGGRVGVGADLVGGPLDLGEGPFDGAEEGPPGDGQREGAAAPDEQVDAEVLLQADEGAGEGRLGDVHLLGGPGDVLGAGHAGEVREAGREQRDDVFCVTGR